jgi:hypothetical protein
MEPGGPLTGEAQAIEDAAFAHIAGAPRAQHLLPSGTPATPYPLIRKSPGGTWRPSRTALLRDVRDEGAE